MYERSFSFLYKWEVYTRERSVQKSALQKSHYFLQYYCLCKIKSLRKNSQFNFQIEAIIGDTKEKPRL
jgi:hypothetical protein